jgi:ubiquitin C
MEIEIRLLTGPSFIVEVEPFYTTEQVKLLCEKVIDYKADDMRFIHAGRGMEDGRQISDYNITHGSLVHCVFRLRGGL